MRKSVDRIKVDEETDVIEQMQCRNTIYRKKKTQVIIEEDEQDFDK